MPVSYVNGESEAGVKKKFPKHSTVVPSSGISLERRFHKKKLRGFSDLWQSSITHQRHGRLL
jgi:hypothetical protein